MQEGLIPENLPTEDNDASIPRRSSGLQGMRCFWARGCHCGPFSMSETSLVCTHLPRELTSVKGNKSLRWWESKPVCPGKQKRTLLSAFGTSSMNERYFNMLPSRVLCICWEPRMLFCVFSPASSFSSSTGQICSSASFSPVRNMAGLSGRARCLISLFSLCLTFLFSFAGL